ncbi:hypothetical protein LNQ52_20245 [Klebsiella pneumoniae subsp. pneumoniae]|nr:hypothetical protein [Klebsiella pneumoniae subsp. pneumoniae]
MIWWSASSSRCLPSCSAPAIRYSGAGVGYQVASVVGGGFTRLLPRRWSPSQADRGTAWPSI